MRWSGMMICEGVVVVRDMIIGMMMLYLVKGKW